MSIQLLEGTGAANSRDYGAHDAAHLPATFIAPSLGVGETIVIQISYDGGTNWVDLKLEGVTVTLTDTNNAVTLFGPGIYRGVRSAGASPLYVSFPQNP